MTSIPAPGNETIMVVDDEKPLVDMMQKTLSSLGYTVTGFTDGRSAIGHFAEHPDRFDLIVTDLSMPEMTGVDLSEKILSIRKDIPIVLCTGYSKTITRDKFRSSGIRAFLMKPVTRVSLSAALRDIFDTK